MANKNSRRDLRGVLLEIGAIIPVTDEEVDIYENANKADSQASSGSMKSFDSVLKRGRELLKNDKPLFSSAVFDKEHSDMAMAAREGGDIPEHIRNRMEEAKKRLKK